MIHNTTKLVFVRLVLVLTVLDAIVAQTPDKIHPPYDYILSILSMMMTSLRKMLILLLQHSLHLFPFCRRSSMNRLSTFKVENTFRLNLKQVERISLSTAVHTIALHRCSDE
jgi:hypothetical protein